jgi:hypothetical protein
LKSEAAQNPLAILVNDATFQPPMSRLNARACWNTFAALVTLAVFHLLMSALNALAV